MTYMSPTFGPLSVLSHRVPQARRLAHDINDFGNAEVTIPLLESAGRNDSPTMKKDSCNMNVTLNGSSDPRLRTSYITEIDGTDCALSDVENLQSFQKHDSDPVLPENHGCFIDTTRQLGRDRPATMSQLHRTISYLGMKQITGDAAPVYAGNLGNLKNTRVVIDALDDPIRRTFYSIAPSTPSRISDLLSAVAVLKRAINDFKTPISFYNRIPIASGCFRQTRTRKNVEGIFKNAGWTLNSYTENREPHEPYYAASRPKKHDDGVLIVIPSTPKISHLTLRMHAVDGSLADLRYYRNLLETMFGKPS